MKTLNNATPKTNNGITFNSIYSRYQQGIFFFINGKVNNSALAQDLAQDTFTKIYVNLHRYNSNVGALSTWVYNVAKNVVIDHYRKEKNKQSVTFDEVIDQRTIENTQKEIENKELKDQILDAFDVLNEKEKKIAELVFLKELEYHEIAERFLIPIGTVKGMIFRIRGKLQEKLSYLNELA